MGNLHAGHLSLCQQAKNENDITVVSIFVNPTQFNQSQDFQAYPRTIEQDTALLKKNKIDYVILPTQQAMYPDNYEIQVTENNLSKALEGQCRPGHFAGMLTVVLKLLNLVQANNAYFGEKDFQQLLLIKKMAAALFLPVAIKAGRTVRTEQGLALSSRNNKLDEEQKKLAIHFSRLLKSTQSLAEITQHLQTLGFKVDYIVEQWQRRLGAVYLGETRLIDNISLEEI